MSESSAARDVDHELLGDHNKRQEFEHQLIDRRLTWLLSSQAILYAAFGLTLTEKMSSASAAGDFQDVVVFVGFCTSLLTCVSVTAAYFAKWGSWRKYRRYFKDAVPEPENGRLPWGVNTRVTLVAMLADIAMPVVLAGAWLTLGWL